jgi:SAM-dependent methyltransferase
MAIDTPELRETSTEAAEPSRHPHRDLFLISFLILFVELASIRWFGSTVTFLTFFTNIVLMASFLGMSVGLLTASRRQNFIRTVIPLLTIGVILSLAVYVVTRYWGRMMIDFGERGSPQQIYFGNEFTPRDPFYFVVPIEVIAGLFFLLIAATFIGLGQAMGRAFDAIPNRVVAYSIDILGSLVGILVFGLCSYFRLPPYLWFAVGTVLIFTLVPKLSVWQVGSQWVLLCLMASLAYFENGNRHIIWSPYYKVEYRPNAGMLITNGIGHQQMMSINNSGPGYSLPHLMVRDADGGKFDDVMIIGAGSGNDVSAALAHGAKHIDAVEIEPVLNEVGRHDHPNHPYQDPRVTIHLDDGRSFVKKSTESYDLIQYALVDSLVLHSGYSSLRLESFLFTEQAFRDIKARLKPDGVFMMYNYYRQGWVVGRLEAMAEKVFGRKPLVISLPYREKIDSSSQEGSFTFLMIGNSDKSPVEAVRRRLEKDKFFWVNTVPRLSFPINGYGPQPPPEPEPKVERAEWLKIGPSTVDTSEIGRIPTDDWPFLYLRSAAIPGLNLRGMAMIAGLSLVLLLAFAPVRTIRPNGQMFFLGAGFMLLETKGVVHMALLFGSTWIVNSIVFFSILVMILLSNLFVLAFKPKRLWPYYAFLIAALAVNALVPMSTFLEMEGVTKMVASCTVVFVPVFFAGVIFAASFRESLHPDVDFGSNVGGVILGGLSENLSLALGFDHLLFVAIGYYLLSALLRPRSRALASPGS